MIINAFNVEPRDVDGALSIRQLFSDESFAFDVAFATLDGVHPTVVNCISDRAYYFLEGSASVVVGDEEHAAAKNDLVLISRGTPHALEGMSAVYLVITSPPFDPNNETMPDET